MSWVGWLIVAGLLFYLPILLVRALTEFWRWFADNFLDAGEPRARRPSRSKEKAARGSRTTDLRDSGSHAARVSVGTMVASRIHPLAPLARLARKLLGSKRFDYWVGCALEETNPAKKVKYCSKAVELNPTYVPAWGLKAATLLEMHRYEEAIESFDHVLRLAPSPLAWYRKGLCCYHLKRLDEAIHCFNKALDTCSSSDHALSEEVARQKNLAREELHASGAGNCAP